MQTLNVQNKDTSAAPVREPSRRTAEALPALRHETKDVLKQLHANINYLEDLGGRLGFVLSEVRSVIRR
ncbi:MAG: hypothetical protein KF799_10260 [Bdellovibrionales bacterium]|nr:hypothetical protein [Bdellovibrionales bacterium]